MDEDIEEGGEATVLVDNVEEFSLRYLGAEDTEWSNAWDSEGKFDEDKKNKFPIAVEVTLEVLDPKTKKKYRHIMVSEVRFPNNDPLFKPSKSSSTQQGSGTVSPPNQDGGS